MHAHETPSETYREVADRFDIGINSSVRWVRHAREMGDVAPFDRGGG